MRKPEVTMTKGGGGGGSSSSNSWGSSLCAKSCRLLQKWTSTSTTRKKKKSSSYGKGRNFTSTKFGEDEDDLIIKLHALLGNRWSLIAGRLPGRTDNEVKNYWNSHLRRKLQNKGIDPDSRRSLSQTVIPSTNFTAVKAAPMSYNNQVVSDAGSFSADYGTSPMAMPADLNLELTLTINPSPSSLITCRFTEADNHIQQHVDQFKLGNKQVDHDQFMKNEPTGLNTLLLFR